MRGGVKMKNIKFQDNRVFTTTSRWKEIQFEFVGQRAYVTAYGARCYLDEMVLLDNPWVGSRPIKSEDGEITLVATYSWGLYGEFIEIDEQREAIRFWREVA